jgi:hypothetical protein
MECDIVNPITAIGRLAAIGTAALAAEAAA